MPITYWNMTNYMPFFGLDNVGIEQLRQEIGNKAASLIQNQWRLRTQK